MTEDSEELKEKYFLVEYTLSIRDHSTLPDKNFLVRSQNYIIIKDLISEYT